MLLGLFTLIIIIAAAVGGLFAGGIYTIVLIPLAVIVALLTLPSMLRRRRSEGPGDTRIEQERVETPLPHERPPAVADQPAATPDDIVDARRRAFY